MKNNKYILLCVTFFVTTLSSVTFSHLFYHKGPYLDTLILFIKEKDTHYKLQRTPKNLKITFDKSSLDPIKESLKKLKTDKKYTIQIIQEENSCSLILTLQDKNIRLESYSLISDRFGNGIGIKIIHNNTNIAYFKTMPTKKNPLRIFIDCGHGGTDTGACGITGIYEKEITQSMGKKIAELLQSEGYQVMLSREDDSTIPLDNRTTAANTFKADLCLSLHADSCTRPEKSGISIRIPAQQLGIPLEAGYEQSTKSKNRYLASNNLAYCIVRTFTKVLHISPTVHTDPFQMLLGTHMPTVLIEMGFLSNKHDCELLQSNSYQGLFVKALKDAIKEFYR